MSANLPVYNVKLSWCFPIDSSVTWHNAWRTLLDSVCQNMGEISSAPLLLFHGMHKHSKKLDHVVGNWIAFQFQSEFFLRPSEHMKEKVSAKS